jgi:hypothetical protein
MQAIIATFLHIHGQQIVPLVTDSYIPGWRKSKVSLVEAFGKLLIRSLILWCDGKRVHLGFFEELEKGG